MSKSYSKIRHIKESNVILEQRRLNLKSLITEAVDNNMQLLWTSCGGDNTELTPDAKSKLELGDKVGGKQLYYFSSEPKDTVGSYSIMECLGPEINKKDDLEIEVYDGKNYLIKHY